MTMYETYTKAKINELLNAKQNALTSDNAGTGINITDGVISATGQVSGMVVKSQLVENTDFTRNGTYLILNNYNYGDVYIIRIGEVIDPTSQLILSGNLTFCTFNTDISYTVIYDSHFGIWKCTIRYESGVGFKIGLYDPYNETAFNFTNATIQGVKLVTLA